MWLIGQGCLLGFGRCERGLRLGDLIVELPCIQARQHLALFHRVTLIDQHLLDGALNTEDQACTLSFFDLANSADAERDLRGRERNSSRCGLALPLPLTTTTGPRRSGGGRSRCLSCSTWRTATCDQARGDQSNQSAVNKKCWPFHASYCASWPPVWRYRSRSVIRRQFGMRCSFLRGSVHASPHIAIRSTAQAGRSGDRRLLSAE